MHGCVYEIVYNAVRQGSDKGSTSVEFLSVNCRRFMKRSRKCSVFLLFDNMKIVFYMFLKYN